MQEKLFELGCKNLSDNSTKVRDAYLFYINEDLQIVVGVDFSRWVDNRNKAIEVSEVMAIQIKEEEKPRFDPKSLQAYDKVLTRCNEQDIWRCNLFSHRQEDNYGCTAGCYSMCIPYNEETKYLIGTANEAPEFYRI